MQNNSTSTTSRLPSRVRSHLRSFPTLVVAFGLAVIVSIWVFAIERIADERTRTMKRVQANAIEYATSLGERTADAVRQIDQALRVIQFEAVRLGVSASLNDLLRLDGLLPSQLVTLMSVADAAGNLVAASSDFEPVNIADREHFKVHAERAADLLFIGPPIVGRVTRRVQIQFSRRLSRPDGLFAGEASIGVDPTFFLRDYDTARLGQRGAVGLVGLDGVLRARRVGNETFVGERSLVAVPAPAQRTLGSAIKTAESPFDQVRRITAFRRIENYPLIAFVGLSEDEVMGKYRRRRAYYVLAAAIGSLLIAAFTAFMARQGRQIDRSRRAADAARATFVAASEASLDALYIMKSERDAAGTIQDFVFVEVNPRGAQLIARAQSEIVGKKLCALLPGSRSDGLFDKYVRVAETGERLEEESRLAGAGGAARWLQRQVVRVNDGVAITSRNITARKQAEVELRNSRAFFQSLIDNLPIGIFVKSMREETRGRFVLWNDAASVITGYAPAQVIGRTDREVFEPRLAERYQKYDRAMLDDPMVMTFPELNFKRPDGQMRILHLTMVPIFDEEGRVEHILGLSTDITKQKRTERELAEQRAELEAVHDASPLGQFRTDVKGRLTYVNDTIERIIGHSRASLIGSDFGAAIHEEDRERIVAAWRATLASRGAFNEIYRIVRPDGRIMWVSVKTAPVKIAAEVSAFVGTIDDITHAKEGELALRESEAILRTITDALPMRVGYIDSEERYRFNNLAYETYYGVPREKIYGMTMRELVGDDVYSRNAAYLRRALQGETVIYEMEPTGLERRNFRFMMIPHRKDGEGEVLGAHLIAQDITAQKFEQQRLSRMAERDSLTALLNRAGFEDRLADAIRNDGASGTRAALMYLDIDRFKDINDTHGHAIGDAFLKAFAGRLTRCVRTSDLVARVGGDEFTIILERLAHPSDAAHVAAKIMQTMQEPFDLVGVVVHATTSIGIAFHEAADDAASDPGSAAQALIKRADALLYEAKAAGRNGYRMAEFPGA